LKEEKRNSISMKNHILVVDDDALVCRATARLVEHVTGCATECCGSGDEALRVFQARPDEFACVVTDFNMPGMNGLELGDSLRALAPGLRMLLVTGSPGALDGAEVKQRGFDCLLAKPFDLAAIKDALRGILPLADSGPAGPAHNSPGDGALFFERLRGTLHAFV
jgi:CheY-like chemotaxis protein